MDRSLVVLELVVVLVVGEYLGELPSLARHMGFVPFVPWEDLPFQDRPYRP